MKLFYKKLILNNLTRIRFIGLYLTVGLIVVSFSGMLAKGLNLGIDFTGGFITEFSTSEPVNQGHMKAILEEKIQGNFILTSAEEEKNWIVRQPDIIDGKTSKLWLKELNQESTFKEGAIQIEALDSDYIGTQIGKELIDQGGLAMLTALIIIMLYLSVRFEWRFALGAILALFHDVAIVLGIFAWAQLEFNLTVLASLMAIIGYSLNDSIIVADRIRELMRSNKDSTLSNIVNMAIKSTLTRTLITSGTTLTTIASVWWLAGTPLEGFSVALFAGILVGTFSSICISATLPELIGLDVEHYKNKKEQDDSLNTAP
jgi:preprotein translocase subunit SecF